ncbi:hypothetical protein Poly51_11480 [Rubripirellula tenax]|uniref:Inner membrane protein YjcH n=1 Tax=Rubripirellula tenax TaxID=2528015 RepID=A0A5C6FGK5_9BACT|nr:DUF485 domain-containing protein [Rubripirellula tenax]TWU60866.1 hypothetical protein Poly51_11480 [Rubripirellula tenax]
MENSDSASMRNRRYNIRLGLYLFAIYTALYVGFVLINAFAPDVMDTIVLAGLNLAIVYGFSLIIAALVMALIYGAMCRSEGSSTENGDSANEGAAK